MVGNVLGKPGINLLAWTHRTNLLGHLALRQGNLRHGILLQQRGVNPGHDHALDDDTAWQLRLPHAGDGMGERDSGPGIPTSLYLSAKPA
ncbi:MAG: hypothetical protein MZV63_15620 [Marinilabiliales bacterium]|nr:hypothetical protein [Marinilabiliales bacterium]